MVVSVSNRQPPCQLDQGLPTRISKVKLDVSALFFSILRPVGATRLALAAIAAQGPNGQRPITYLLDPGIAAEQSHVPTGPRADPAGP